MAGSVGSGGPGAAEGLEAVVAAARGEPALLAARLGAGGRGAELAARLGLDRTGLDRLLLCGPPRPSRFAADVAAVAGYVGTDATTLAGLLREADALVALRAERRVVLGGAEPGPGLLAAARSVDDAQVSPVTELAQRCRELAAAFWDRAPEPVRRDRDVAAALAYATPLAVVGVRGLTLGAVRRWLRERAVPVAGSRDDRLRGLLVAVRGVGVVFYDATLGEAERRFTLAHELGHFTLEYDEPRRAVLREAPELLEVVDGLREPTPADRAHAVLAGVPLGVHAHALGDGHEPAEQEDQASRFALELLSAWPELLAVVRDAVSDAAAYRARVEAAIAAVVDTFELPGFAARARALQALDAMGIRPGFFEE